MNVPNIPAVQGRRIHLTISTDYKIPAKCINDNDSLNCWLESEAYLRILDFCQTLNSQVKNKKITDGCFESTLVSKMIELLDKIDAWIDEIPPEQGGQRYGNISFRKWNLRLQQVLQFKSVGICRVT